MASVYISELTPIVSISGSDFIPLVQSSSLTTYRTNFNAIGAWISSSVTSAYALSCESASISDTSFFSFSASYADSASYLIYTGIPNGTASYAISSSHALTASYYDLTGFIASYAVSALSASWASQSLSSSYVAGANVRGTVSSASYALTSSYAISSSYGISGSHAMTASYALTSSHALYAENIVSNVVSVYGPLTASMSEDSPTVGWSRWDYEKQAIAFSITETANVLLECNVNYSIDEDSTKYYYIGAILRADGLDDPTINPPSAVSDFDHFQFLSLYDFSANAKLDSNAKFYIKKNGLTAGTWILYLTFYSSDISAPYISPWGTSGVGQKSTLDTFLASSPTRVITGQVRFYKFSNSSHIIVHSTTPISQEIKS